MARINVHQGKKQERQGKRAKKMKGIEVQSVKPPTPSQAIDTLIGDNEQNKSRRKNKRKKRSGLSKMVQKIIFCVSE